MTLNLRTPGAGLMETHVTWEDIEARIDKEKGGKTRFGEKKTIRNIGDGNGFMSRIGLVETDWQSNPHNLPARFVIKIATCLAGKSIGEDMKKVNPEEEEEEERLWAMFETISKTLHNCEVTTYGLLSKYGETNVNALQIHFTHKYEDDEPLKGFIGMEYSENVYVRHIYNNVKPSDLSEVLRTLARLQVCGRKFTESEREKLPNIMALLYGSLTKKELLEKLFISLGDYGDDSLKEKAAEVSTMADEFQDLSCFAELNKILGMEDVFIHGDLWSTNLMWKKTENGVELTRIIDYQMTHFGCAAEDLVRILFSTLSGKDRQDHWEQLLEQFYGYLTEELNGQKAPYTLEQLKEAYLRMLPIACTLLIAIAGSLVQASIKNSSEEEKTKVNEVMAEKLDAVFDDMIRLLKRNKQIVNGTH